MEGLEEIAEELSVKARHREEYESFIRHKQRITLDFAMFMKEVLWPTFKEQRHVGSRGEVHEVAEPLRE